MIRTLCEQDYVEAKRLMMQVHELHVQHRPDIYVNENPLPKEYFDQLCHDQDSLSYVYEEGGKLCGLLLAVKRTNRPIPITRQRTIYVIDTIVVDDQCKRKGIGKKLYAHMLALAHKERMDGIELTVWSFNEAALAFYQSLGLSMKTINLEQSVHYEP